MQRNPETNEISAIYARRNGRKDEPAFVYAHRELIGCYEDRGVVDHLNGWGLDNRRGTSKHPVNLRYASYRENGHNTVRTRTKHLALPRGVELRGKNRHGKQRYGGMYCRRFGKKVKSIRSKRTWLTPTPAARWYQNWMKMLHQDRTSWAHNPTSVQYPLFPPSSYLYDVPF